jgi:hypothetical protein
MNETNFSFGFYGLCIVLGSIALTGILSGRGVLRFPTLAAMVGIAWVIPQGIEIEGNPNNLYASNLFWLYVASCFVAIALGFRSSSRAPLSTTKQSASDVGLEYDTRRLLIGAFLLFVVGVISLYFVRSVDTSSMGSGWTGVITAYALLSKCTGLSLCLAVLIFARTQSKAALALAIAASGPLLMNALVSVRREQIFDLIVLTGGSWYLARRKSPPRIAIIVALILGTIVLNRAGDLRGLVNSGGSLVGALMSGETYTNFNYFDLKQGKSSEVGQAQHDFWYMNETGQWEYGAGYWNAIVTQYVPAFLLGRETKESLKISTFTERLKSGLQEGAFSMGATRTGFSDSYINFSFAGAMIFWLIGYFYGRLYAVASAGGISGQYYYLVLLAEGLKAITHSTAELLSSLPFVFAVSFAVFQFSRVKRTRPIRNLQQPKRGALTSSQYKSSARIRY